MSKLLSGMYRLPEIDRVVFGRPAAQVIAEEVLRLDAKRVFLLASHTLNSQTNEVGAIEQALGSRHAGTWDRVIAHTPRQNVIDISNAARVCEADLLVSIGGGSVTDAGKMVELCLANEVKSIEQLDAFRASGPGLTADRRVMPRAPTVRLISVPTTLSAGDFTAYAGCTDARHGVKETYLHPMNVPCVVVLDPAVTRHTPRELWLSTGVRAIDHAVEDICSIDTQPFSEASALHAIRLLSAGLKRTHEDTHDLTARQNCQIGMWLSTIGSQAGVRKGASHAIGHVLGAAAGVPHGLTSCVMLPSVLRYNVSVNAARQRLVSEAFGAPERAAGDLVEALIRQLGLPSTLAEVGVNKESFEAIAIKSMNDPWTHTNPRKIQGSEDVVRILQMAAG